MSTVEAKGAAPVFGVQWHPERNIFEIGQPGPKHINHSYDAVRAMQSVANFLVHEARASTHVFPEHDVTWQNRLIYSFEPTFIHGSYRIWVFQ